MKRIASLLLLLSLFSCFHVAAEDKKDYAYYGFEPDIVTNYISNRKKLGFVKISVELMVNDPTDLVALEHHDPLLRSAIVEILGNQEEDKVKSLSGREEIRRECFEMVNRLMQQETGKETVVNLLFTKYLYD
ncbi:flagellar basal body-associated protein FliL [Shewanella intestini]|uniref:Flagellar protein FliL n=1 Tax=Shewanella intestini TaxID=2017544 RepID=A0ABS5I5K4_9GAMM|nr:MULTISPECIES: flagellar basal body-associated protein FliL [Shewanella]MBR9729302.1 flagellar basal body-associated protein FliL [Shewanella intestini]MRG37381.1 flagellar basal body-associated protein FliL [Shewanella sp. XMDDZSB0408]